MALQPGASSLPMLKAARTSPSDESFKTGAPGRHSRTSSGAANCSIDVFDF